MRGFTGNFCDTCGSGYTAYNSTLCVPDESIVCEKHGGWDIVANKCNNCTIGTGDLCTTCENSQYYN